MKSILFELLGESVVIMTNSFLVYRSSERISFWTNDEEGNVLLSCGKQNTVLTNQTSGLLG